MAKVQLYSSVRPLGEIAEEDHWSDIEAMSPMSPSDKVTEFLLQSQSMLQSYGQLHNLRLPGVRLEINNEYTEPDLDAEEHGGLLGSGVGGSAGPLLPGITDIKLEATIGRTSPKRTRGGDTSVKDCRVPRSHSEPEIWQKHWDPFTPGGASVPKVKITEKRQSTLTKSFMPKQKTTPV